MDPTISSLPPELLDNILAYSPKQTRLDLCSVSRLFNSVATRRVYQNLHLKTCAQTLRCFRTLSFNLTICQAVRSVLVDVRPQRSRPVLFAPAYSIISQALENISFRVVDLNFLGIDVDGLLPAHCPQLRNLFVSASVSMNIGPFLARHTKLETLMLPDYNTGFTSPGVCFPSLSFLTCSSDIAVSLAPGSQLSQIGIVWDPRTIKEDLEVLFRSLQQTTVPLLAFTSHRWTPRVDMFPFVSQHMHHLEQLCFNCFQPSTVDEEIWEEGMNAMLPSLKNMTFIEILWDTPPELTMALLDKEFNIVTRWGSSCPSLETCYMPSNLEWLRLKDAGSAWIPRTRTDDLMCTRWLERQIRSDGTSDLFKGLFNIVTKLDGSPLDLSSHICDTWGIRWPDITDYRGLRAFKGEIY